MPPPGACAILLSRLFVTQPARTARAPTSFIEDVVVGAKWLVRHEGLHVLLVWGAVVNASLVAFGSIYVLFALEILRVSEAAFGFLAASIGLGGITGTLVAGRVFGAIPLGALAGGWLASAFGLRAPYLIGGAIVVLAGLLIGLWVNDASIARSRERTGGTAAVGT